MRHGSALIVIVTTGLLLAGCGASTLPVEDNPVAESQLPLSGSSYNAREGRTVFLYYCAPCHGETGQGDGFNAYNLDPKPRDLSATEFQAERTDDELFTVIHGGGGFAGLSNRMPPWGRTLNERQIQNVVLYLQYLPEESPE